MIVALNLYLQLPFGKMHQGNAEIIQLAALIGRTPSAVAMRLSNFASVDPYHQSRGIGGLTGGMNQVQPIWDEFINNKEDLLFESERILAALEKKSVEKKFEKELSDLGDLKGEVRIAAMKTRVNQHVFRRIVLANYDFRCAVTGIDVSELLVASHILPWGSHAQERLNPENGLCLSPLFDKAFDKGLMTITNSYTVRFSPKITAHATKPYFEKHFSPFEGSKISIPAKYLPRKEFLEFHADTIFQSK